MPQEPFPRTYNADLIDTTELAVEKVGGVGHISAEQAVPSGTETTVEIDTVGFDHFDAFDTDNFCYIVPHDGTFLVAGAVNYATVADGTSADVWLSVDGVGKARTTATVGVGDQLTATVSRLVTLTEGQQIDLRTLQSTGSEQTVEASTELTHLSVTRLG